MKTSPNVFKCYLSSPFFCEGSRKQPKYFPLQTPSYSSECPMVSSIPATVHLRPQTVQLCLAMPPPSVHLCPAIPSSNCPPVSSYAPLQLSTGQCPGPPMSSYAPLQLSTTGVPGSYRRRHRLTLLPLWRAVCRTYMSYIYICPNWITEEYHQQQSTQQFHTPSRWPRRLSIEHPCHQGLQKQPTLDTLDIIGSEVCC